MDREALDTFRSYRQQSETLVSQKFEGQEKRDTTFLLTCALMARDQLKGRQGIKDFFDYAVAHQDELLSLARELDDTITSFNETANTDIEPAHMNTVSVRGEDKLGKSGKLPLLLGEQQVRPKEALRQIEAAKRAFAAQNTNMENSELAQDDRALYKVIHESGNWSELHLNAKSPKHFLATFMIDLYPGMLRRTGMYGAELDTDELVRALCENLNPKSEFFKLIKEQGWITEEEFSPDFIREVQWFPDKSP